MGRVGRSLRGGVVVIEVCESFVPWGELSWFVRVGGGGGVGGRHASPSEGVAVGEAQKGARALSENTLAFFRNGGETSGSACVCRSGGDGKEGVCENGVVTKGGDPSESGAAVHHEIGRARDVIELCSSCPVVKGGGADEGKVEVKPCEFAAQGR